MGWPALTGCVVWLCGLAGASCGGGGDSNRCTPDTLFCLDDRVERCSADGATSSLHEDCRLAPVLDRCSECTSSLAPEAAGCVSVGPVCTGTMHGIAEEDYDIHGPVPCSRDDVCTAARTATGLVVRITFTDETRLVFDANHLGSGDRLSLHGTSGGAGPILAYDTPLASYRNRPEYAAGVAQPPAGTVRLDGDGLASGDSFAIEIAGHLSRDDATWEEFTFFVTGLLTEVGQ